MAGDHKGRPYAAELFTFKKFKMTFNFRMGFQIVSLIYSKRHKEYNSEHNPDCQLPYLPACNHKIDNIESCQNHYRVAYLGRHRSGRPIENKKSPCSIE